MADVLYVRNTRPNAVLMRVDGLKVTVERRGSREDSAALPGEWRGNPQVSTFLNRGILEEISKDSFMMLTGRPEDVIVEERGRPKRIPGVTETPLKARVADEINIPINNPDQSREPYVITEENLRKSASLRTPTPEFASSISSTAEDLEKIEEARKAAEENPGRVDFPESETEQLKLQVQELTGLVQKLLQNQAEVQQPASSKAVKTAKKAPAKKKATSKAKKDSTHPMEPKSTEPHTSSKFVE